MIKMKWHTVFVQAVFASTLLLGSGLLTPAGFAAAVPTLTDKSVTAELAFWNSIKDSKNSTDFKTYLENFPNGMFFDPAMQKFLQTGGNKSDLAGSDVKTNPKDATQVKKANTAPDIVKAPDKRVVKALPKHLPAKHVGVVTRTSHRAMTLHCRSHFILKNGSCVALHVSHKKVRRAALSHRKAPAAPNGWGEKGLGSGSGGTSGGGGGWGG